MERLRGRANQDSPSDTPERANLLGSVLESVGDTERWCVSR